MKPIVFRDLRPDEIEVRVGNIVKDKNGNPKGFQLLLYKTSRTDMAVLDETFGTFGWKNNFYQVKNTMVCSIQIYDEEKHEWINKDNGGDDDFTVEQVKAELSDAMKRAGSTLGIGRKLYTASKIYMVVDITETNTTKSYFQVKEIEYDETSITKLIVINKKTKEEVINYNGGKSTPKTPKKEEEEVDNGEPLGNEEREFLTAYVRGLSAEQYNNFFVWLEKQFGTRKIAELTKVQGKKAVAILKNRRK